MEVWHYSNEPSTRRLLSKITEVWHYSTVMNTAQGACFHYHWSVTVQYNNEHCTQGPAFVKFTRSKSYTRKPPMLMDCLGKIVKMAIPRKVIYRFNGISIKIQWSIWNWSWSSTSDLMPWIRYRIDLGIGLNSLAQHRTFLDRTPNRISWNQKVSVQQKPPSFEWRGSLQNGNYLFNSWHLTEGWYLKYIHTKTKYQDTYNAL